MAAAQQQDRQTNFSGCGSFLSHPSLDSIGLSHLMEAEHNGPQQNVATAYEDLINGWNNLIDDSRDPSAFPGENSTAVDSHHSRWISELANAASGKSDRNLPNFFQSTAESFVGSDYCLFDGGDARMTHPNLAAPPGLQCSDNSFLDRGSDNVIEASMADQSFNVSQDVFNQLAEIDCSQPMMIMADSQPFYPELGYSSDAAAAVQGNCRNNEVWSMCGPKHENASVAENVPTIVHNRSVRTADRLLLFNGSQGDSSSLSSNEGVTPLSNMPSSSTRSNRRSSFQMESSGMQQQPFDDGEGNNLNIMRAIPKELEDSVPAAGNNRRHRKSMVGGGSTTKRSLEDSVLSSNCGGGWTGGSNTSRRHLCSGGGGGGNSAGNNSNINRSFSSSLSKFTLPDENGKRKIRHDIMSIAESLPSLPGLYFDKKQKGFRVRYQNVYVGWVALSRFPSIEEAYCSARDIWENAKAHAEKFQTPHAAVMASLPLQKEAQASGKNRGGRPRTVTQLPPSTAEWLASAFCTQAPPPNSSAWGSKYHQQLLSTDSLLSITERENAAAWKSVASELALRAANGTLDLHTLQMAGITENDLLESLQGESQWTPPPGYAHSNAILTPSSTKASETSPPLSEHLYQSAPQLMDSQDAAHCYNPNLLGDVAVGGTLGGAISYSKPVEEDCGQYGLAASLAAEQAALACWAGSGTTVENFCTLSGTLTACNDPALSVWDVGNNEQAAMAPEGGGIGIGRQQHH